MSTQNWPVFALDAGHGLNTPGKRTPDGIHEWEIADKARDYAAEYLEPYKCKVIFPDRNEGKTDESLTSRRSMAISADVDALVSMHLNAHLGYWGSANGAETWVDKNCTAADLELANLIQKKMVKYMGLKNRGVKKENWTVINTNKVVAVLTEGGFMDNKKDHKIITSAAGQKAYGRAVAEALIELFDLEKKEVVEKAPVKKTDTTKVKKTNFQVKFKEKMEVRKGAGTKYIDVGDCRKGYVYTIKKTKKVNGVLWGYLKSGAGWVCIDNKYCTRVKSA